MLRKSCSRLLPHTHSSPITKLYTPFLASRVVCMCACVFAYLPYRSPPLHNDIKEQKKKTEQSWTNSLLHVRYHHHSNGFQLRKTSELQGKFSRNTEAAWHSGQEKNRMGSSTSFHLLDPYVNISRWQFPAL